MPILTKKWIGLPTFRAIFRTNSSGHPDETAPENKMAEKMAPCYHDKQVLQKN
jgi:hypothetical protein